MRETIDHKGTWIFLGWRKYSISWLWCSSKKDEFLVYKLSFNMPEPYNNLSKYSYNVVLYSNSKNKLLLHSIRWIYLKDTMLRERNQTQKSTSNMIPFIWSSNTSQKNQSIVMEVRRVEEKGYCLRRGPKYASWDARNALYLDLGGNVKNHQAVH